MTVGMSAPPIGTIIMTPKSERDDDDQRKQERLLRMEHEDDGDNQRNPQQREVDDVLSLVGDRALRQHLLELAGRHQAAGEGQAAEDDLQGEHRHRERRALAGAET